MLMEKIAGFFTTYKDLLIAISWIFVVSGWLVSSRQANDRERRKETRTEIDAICKAAIDIVDKCRKYYGVANEDSDDQRRVAEIYFEMKRFLIRAERLSRRVPSFSSAVLACGDFWDLVTEEPFDAPSRPVHGPRSKLLGDIEMSVHRLIGEFEENFTAEYLSSWRFRLWG